MKSHAQLTANQRIWLVLLAGDVIIAVDGESVVNLGFDEVLLMVRARGNNGNLDRIRREGEDEPLDFTIVRAAF